MIYAISGVLQKLAKTGVTYDHCSTQVDIEPGVAQEVLRWGNAHIPEDILHNDGKDTKGRENDIHVTLLYGLTDVNPDDIRRFIPPDMKQITLRMGLITAFMDKPEYDVLKIDIESPELLRLHYLLRKSLPNKNSFPTYSPHCTVAYLKKGEALRYVGDSTFRGKMLNVPVIKFCGKTGGKIDIGFE